MLLLLSFTVFVSVFRVLVASANELYDSRVGNVEQPITFGALQAVTWLSSGSALTVLVAGVRTEIRGQKSEVRSQRSGIRNQKSVVIVAA